LHYAAPVPVPSTPPPIPSDLFSLLPFRFNFLSRFRSGYRFVRID
jgi:hypothetical protein